MAKVFSHSYHLNMEIWYCLGQDINLSNIFGLPTSNTVGKFFSFSHFISIGKFLPTCYFNRKNSKMKEAQPYWLINYENPNTFLSLKLSNMLVWYNHFFSYVTQNNYQISSWLWFIYENFSHKFFWGVNVCSVIVVFYFLHILKFKKYSIPLLITVHLLHYPQSLVSPWTLK